MAIDRDDDFGFKAGVKAPVIGRDACIDAAVKLSLADPEDSDANVLYAAVKLYDELKEKGEFEDVEVALITGHHDVGVKSDLELNKQMDKVLAKFPADGVIPVTDGAEDEQIFPIIASKVPIISTRRVVVKQSESIETTYYIIYRYFKEVLSDPEVAKIVLGLPGLVLLLYGIARLISIKYPESINIVSSTVAGTILLLIGGYFFNKGFNLVSYFVTFFRHIRESMSKGLVNFVSTIAGLFVIMAGAIHVYFNFEYYIRNSNIPGIPTDPLLAGITYMYFFNNLLITGLTIIVTGKILQAYMKKDYHIWHYLTALLLIPGIWVTIDITTSYVLNLTSPVLIDFYKKVLIAVLDIILATLMGMYLREKVRGWRRVEAGESTSQA
ncbi:hypothetical protein PAP_06245 [Palaeococcus pacificus DY20341]|uniref:DUF373 family protein n=1 Tax=Palaeococcus pacificus DY20341 TaxID=1343739 RepID=A0A075LUJ2_9EURY|nr:hypothetical protein PAP_06245 [Palaeococcus pacificus DY20341]